MKDSLTDKLCCPVDKHDLEIEVFARDEVAGEILEALMTCPRCSRYFPVIYGIPVLIPDEYRDRSLEGRLLKKWGYRLDDGRTNRLLPIED
ncbi:MAG: Trm112 family protein [Woeseia sp.]